MTADNFDLTGFLPYLTFQAAERLSQDFGRTYKARHGILRTEWRVLFHLGRYGPMTAREICDRASLHKTKVSRAVAALERRRWLVRTEDDTDRRRAHLALTRSGAAVFEDLRREAVSFDARLNADMTPEETEIVHRCLRRFAGLETKD